MEILQVQFEQLASMRTLEQLVFDKYMRYSPSKASNASKQRMLRKALKIAYGYKKKCQFEFPFPIHLQMTMLLLDMYVVSTVTCVCLQARFFNVWSLERSFQKTKWLLGISSSTVGAIQHNHFSTFRILIVLEMDCFFAKQLRMRLIHQKCTSFFGKPLRGKNCVLFLVHEMIGTQLTSNQFDNALTLNLCVQIPCSPFEDLTEGHQTLHV